ncbi:MAG: hypothetical protein KGD59_05260 [Candidatus Heimdallarchaeota archaeon]|nr:hypothetical protein [Candidatus Heimdallarchaeota archaeon]MBY8993938.1 hypothetical protein [Candidatus Heimdallarchaeota archaeon]
MKKIRKNKSGVSNIISTLLITSIMITSVALTYSYLIPTIDRGRTTASVATSTLFLTKVDDAIQSMFYDGVGSARLLSVDPFEGTLGFSSMGLNFRAFIDGAIYLPIPGLEYGLARLSIPSEIGIMSQNTQKYVKGGPFFPPAVTQDGTIDPATLILERPDSESYQLRLWYRLQLLIRDTGVGGEIDVSVIAVNFNAVDELVGLSSGSYHLIISKQSVDVNPTYYGFPVNGDPITTSGDDFRLTINTGTGPIQVYNSNGARTRVSINLVIINIGLQMVVLE